MFKNLIYIKVERDNPRTPWLSSLHRPKTTLTLKGFFTHYFSRGVRTHNNTNIFPRNFLLPVMIKCLFELEAAQYVHQTSDTPAPPGDYLQCREMATNPPTGYKHVAVKNEHVTVSLSEITACIYMKTKI